MNLLTLPSESQVISTSVPLRSGGVVEAMDRHDREELAERPVIEERLEDGEVADVLIAQRRLEFLHFVRHVLQAAMQSSTICCAICQ